MESSFKMVMGAAVIGIFLGVAGLVFGIVSKNKADELRRDFSVVQDLVEKIREVEDSSSGISASATRIRREVDSLRDGTQDALDRVSAELTRVRGDLNDSLALARGLQERFVDLQKPPAPDPAAELAAETPEEEPEAASEVRSESLESDGSRDSAESEVYVIRAGDTLTAVASKSGISLDRLMEANPTVDPVRMQIGQKIKIPAR